jgi:hypothetical protein
MEDPFDFQALRVQQPRKLLPSRANYEIFTAQRKLVALVNEADTHTRLALLRQAMPDTRVLTVATPAGAPILTLIKQTSEWITELLSPDEERVGLIRTEGSRRHYTLIDEQDKTVGKVEGDLGLKHFTAKSPKGEKFALVRKTFAGFAKEMLTPSDHYKVEFIAPAAQPARTLIIMLPIVLDLTLYGPV